MLPELNAILANLGEGSGSVLDDAFERAKRPLMFFFEQYSHEPQIAVRRSLLINLHRKHLATPERLAETLEGGNRALAVMEGALAAAPFLVGQKPTLADIGAYAYSHVAADGGSGLAAFPAILARSGRIESLERYCPLGAGCRTTADVFFGATEVAAAPAAAPLTDDLRVLVDESARPVLLSIDEDNRRAWRCWWTVVLQRGY